MRAVIKDFLTPSEKNQNPHHRGATGSAQFTGVVKDANGNTGSIGQIRSSTASGVAWIPAGASNTDSQTIAFGSSATSSQTTLEITDGNALTLQASGALSFTQTGTNTLELAVAVVDSNTDTQTIAFGVLPIQNTQF